MNVPLVSLIFALNFITISSQIFEIWNPRALTEMFVKSSKVFSDQIEEQSSAVSSAVNKYVSDQNTQRNHLKYDLENFINESTSQINYTLNEHLNQVNTDMLSAKMVSVNTYMSYNPDMYLDTIQLVKKYGYDAESHVVKTEDGYLLTLHRIPRGKGAKDNSVNKQAVFLQHGLISSSSDFIITGTDEGLAYILADAGYDVWMGNFRGNTYSKAHVSLSTSDSAFWNFSWDEMAAYDLPAMIDYVNRIKQNKEMIYIGHSMGNTVLYALLSTKTEYNSKLKAAFSLAPVAYMTAIKSPIKLLAKYVDNIDWIFEHFGINDFLPQNEVMKWLAKGCDLNSFDERICENVLFVVTGFDDKQFNKTDLPVMLSHSPAGTSTKTFIHFAQEVKDKGKFQHYDHGVEENIKIYGEKTPPEYNVSKITLPIALFYGDNDWLVGVSDAKKLYKNLAKPMELYEVLYKNFNHLDFLWAIGAPTLVYKKLMELMGEYKMSN